MVPTLFTLSSQHSHEFYVFLLVLQLPLLFQMAMVAPEVLVDVAPEVLVDVDVSPEVFMDVDVVMTVVSVTIVVVATTHLTDAGTRLDGLH